MDTSTMCPYCMRENALEYGQCRYCRKQAPGNLPLGVLPPGVVLGGRYVTGYYLGSGGYGITYRALDLVTRQIVAIKEYRPKIFCERSKSGSTLVVLQEEEYKYGLKHFYTEVEILMSLQSVPEVVRYYNSFAENNTAYYVMEYLDALTLQQFLKEHKEKLSYSEAVNLLIPAVLSLQKVHNKGVLHRDISPDNIFICRDGSVKLIDFGASRTQTSRYSNSFMPVEKEGYSPPEQHTLDRDGGNQGPWSDVYAMAGTIYRCVTGKRVPSSSARLAGDQLEFPKGYNSGVNDEQIKVIEKNLSLDRNLRSKSMIELAKDLTGALKEKDAQALRAKYPELTLPVESGSNTWIEKPSSKPIEKLESKPPEKELPGASPAIMIRQCVALCIDILLFQGVPFALSSLLGGNLVFWLAGGYIIGVLVNAYLTAYFLDASPGEMLCGLNVLNRDGKKPDGGEAVLFSVVRLFWPLIPVKLLWKLFSGKNMDTVISGCSDACTHTSVPQKISYPVLTFEKGNYMGMVNELKPGIYTFGRNPEKCNMVYPMNYAGVSREQFKLVIDVSGNSFITDMSTYGTWLNQSKLPKNSEVRVNLPGIISFCNDQEKIRIANQ